MQSLSVCLHEIFCAGSAIQPDVSAFVGATTVKATTGVLLLFLHIDKLFTGCDTGQAVSEQQQQQRNAACPCCGWQHG
jgi:hypothetical protein